MEIAASLRSEQETRLAFRVTFTVMARLVPASGRGTVPLLMAGTRPAMTVRQVSLGRVGHCPPVWNSQ
jgi:hypothetical protein